MLVWLLVVTTLGCCFCDDDDDDDGSKNELSAHNFILNFPLSKYVLVP